MAKTKNIRIKKKGGGFRLQKVQVLRSGKYKFIKNSGSRNRSPVRRASTRRTATKTRRGATLAKRRGSRKRSGMSLGPIGKRVLGGFGYGLVREPVNRLMKQLPFVGTIGDELALGLVAALVRQRTSGTIKAVADAALSIESHNLGRQVSSGGLNFLRGSGSAAPSNGAAPAPTI